VRLADPAADPAGEDGHTLQPRYGRLEFGSPVSVPAGSGGRKVGAVLVERCWLCLEQPAVTTVRSSDGRDYPVCDVCAVEHPHGPDAANRTISDDDLRRIVGDSV
jgi:hypothetical protein